MTRIAVSLFAIGLLSAPALAEVPANKAPATPSAAVPAMSPKADSQNFALARKPARHRRHKKHAAVTAPKAAPATK